MGMSREEAIEFIAQSVKSDVDMALVADAIKTLEQRWIPCSERLPEDREIVLLSTETDKVFEGRFYDDNTDCQWYVFRNETFLPNHVVTAWMPLPKEYKAESEGR